MILQFLAETGKGGDGLYISVAAITAIGLAIAGAIKAFKAGVQKGRDAQDNNVTLKKPVPTINTREEPAWATKPELQDHICWTRDEFNKVWSHFESAHTLDNNELTKIHERINMQSMTTSALKGSVEKIGENVAQLLHLALHGKTPPRSRQ